MDNLTHSLVGIWLAEGALCLRARRSPVSARLRVELYAVSVLGNNLPDLDILYSSLLPRPFGYLLHHRGFTHTLVAAFGFALAQFEVVAWLRRRAGARATRLERIDVASVALLAPLLHIGMDFTNNYGVHPFWPLSGRWFYGDVLFIVEPALWVALLGPLAFSIESRSVRAALWLLLAAGVALLWLRPAVPPREAAVVTAAALALLVAARRASRLGRHLLATASAFVLLGAFLMGSMESRSLAIESTGRALPGARALDVAVTAMPANPFCWSVLWVGLDGDDYVVRVGRAAPWPRWLDLATCAFDRDARPTVPLEPANSAGDPRLVFAGEYRRKVRDLRALAAARCDLAALLVFARVPYATDLFADGSRIAGDVRFDRTPGLDFSDVRMPAIPGPCPHPIPPWVPPRADVFDR